jgi:hypothetical protein
MALPSPGNEDKEGRVLALAACTWNGVARDCFPRRPLPFIYLSASALLAKDSYAALLWHDYYSGCGENGQLGSESAFM